MTKRNKKTFKKYKISMFASIFVFICCISFRLFICNSFAIKNVELNDYFAKREELEKEISSLTYTNSQLASLSIIEAKAKELGFIKMKESLIALDPTAPLKVAALPQ